MRGAATPCSIKELTKKNISSNYEKSEETGMFECKFKKPYDPTELTTTYLSILIRAFNFRDFNGNIDIGTAIKYLSLKMTQEEVTYYIDAIIDIAIEYADKTKPKENK